VSELIMATPVMDGHRRGRRSLLDEGPLLREVRTSHRRRLDVSLHPKSAFG
jgi:hypothetical protein